MDLSDDDMDLIAAYAVDATEPGDELLVESRLAADAMSAGLEAVLRLASGSLAEALTAPVAPPPELRSTTLARALSARPGQVDALSAANTFRLETARFLEAVADLSPADWDAPIDPPELAGWAVRDLVAHVASSQALVAQLLGTDPPVPEVDTTNAGRTDLVRARHAGLRPLDVELELTVASELILEQVGGRSDAELTEVLRYWELEMPLHFLLVHRAFEIWTHRHDLARAISHAAAPSTPGALATMSSTAASLVPMLLADEVDPAGGDKVVLDLTGPGGRRHVIDLRHARDAETDDAHADSSEDTRPVADRQPRFTLRMTVEDFCRAAAARVPEGGLRYAAEGDTRLAATLIAALPSLAGL